MGYESRVYVVERSEFENGCVFTDEIARFKLCKVGYDFLDVFDNNDKGLYVFGDDGDSYIQVDRYGDELTIAKAGDVIEIIQSNSELMAYRRTHDLYMFLQTAIHNYNDLWCIHYGY